MDICKRFGHAVRKRRKELGFLKKSLLIRQVFTARILAISKEGNET